MQAVALIGLILKRSVDERTLSISSAAEARLAMEAERNAALAREAEERLRVDNERNLYLQREDRAVNRVKAVREFFEFLSAPDARNKAAALVLISELGDPELAIRLSTIYQDQGGIDALARLTQSDDSELAQDAVDAWLKVTEPLRQSVVRLSVHTIDGSTYILSGFSLDFPDLVVTVGRPHIGDALERQTIEGGRSQRPPNSERISPIGTDRDRNRSRTKAETTLLRLQSGLNLRPLPLGTTSTLIPGDPLFILSFREGRPVPTQSRGRFLTIEERDLAVSGFETSGGSSGAPIVDGSGRLMGMHYRRVDSGQTYAVRIETIIQELRQFLPGPT